MEINTANNTGSEWEAAFSKRQIMREGFKMSINGIGTAGNPAAGYQAGKAERNASSGAKSFLKTVEEKSAQDKVTEYGEKAFALAGATAPQSVKDAWMETVKEVGVNGLGMTANGSTHITEMHMQQVIANYWGVLNSANILGDSVQSAVRATQKALYDLDHPLEPGRVGSMEEQQARVKEREFYTTFLEKLKNSPEYSEMKAAIAETGTEVKGHNPSRVLDSFAKHAPEEVRQAFSEAEKETGGHFTVGGFWISNDGKEFHITQLAVECLIRWYHGEKNQSDVFGTSVGSAVSAVEKWIYDIDHPLAGQPAKSAEERKLIAMERAFCESFLEKLKKL